MAAHCPAAILATGTPLPASCSQLPARRASIHQVVFNFNSIETFFRLFRPVGFARSGMIWRGIGKAGHGGNCPSKSRSALRQKGRKASTSKTKSYPKATRQGLAGRKGSEESFGFAWAFFSTFAAGETVAAAFAFGYDFVFNVLAFLFFRSAFCFLEGGLAS